MYKSLKIVIIICNIKLAGANINSTFNTLEGEAMPIIEPMEVMMQKGLSHVIFESDSKLVVDAISSSQEGLLEFSTLITHIKSLLRMNNYLEVKYVKRQTNKVAHSLARRPILCLIAVCSSRFLVVFILI
jgi:ribonuclease HI